MFINRKEKIIPWNNFFNNNRPDYITYKIVPDFTIENNQNEVISRAISTLYKTPLERFEVNLKGMKITYYSKRKVFFDILLIPKNAYFYFTVPYESKELFLNKIKAIWNNSAVLEVTKEELNELNKFDNDNSTVSRLISKTYNFKSLKTDKGDLYPLTNMLGIVSELDGELEEKVRLNFDIEPIKRRNWAAKANDEHKAYKKGKILDRERTIKETAGSAIFKTAEFALNMFIEFRMMIFESLLGIVVPKEKENEKIEVVMNSIESVKEENKYIGLSNQTTYKMTSETFSTGITVISQSKSKDRKNLNMVSVTNSYKDLNADNELIVKKLNDKEQKRAIEVVVSLKDATPKNQKSIFSDMEIAKFIQLPQKTLQQLYKLDNIDTRETEIHKDLQVPGIPIGVAEVKRERLTTYWCNDYNSIALTKIVGGPPGSGKSNYTINFIAGANRLGHCTITFDYIKNCELTEEACKRTKDNIIIDLSDVNNLPSFSYPEISYKLNEFSTPFERKEIASDISKQVVYLINAITDDNTGSLTSAMIRYLKAAARVVFIHEGETLDNCLRVLEDHKVRQEYIRKTKGIYDYDDRVLNTLRELNKTEEDGKIIGTRHDLIIGVMNRIDRLQDDPRLELMLKAKADNYNFTDYMNEGKAVYIKMPQDIFKDKTTKDIIVTCFMTRIIMACYERSKIDKPNICHVIVDEVHQIPTAADLLKDYITEFRKFGIAPYFTVHYLKQFKTLLDAVKNSGASYILMNGLEKENLIVLKEEIQPFTIEEVMNLGEWKSLNIIKHNNKYSKFISKMGEVMK